MRLLLDTHILLWALSNDARLPRQARSLVLDASNDVLQHGELLGVEIKHLAHPQEFSLCAQDLITFCNQAGFSQLTVRNDHVLYLPQLQLMDGAKPHHNPFDRMMICQAAVENMLFVTHDSLIAGYNEPCIFAV